MMLFNNDLERDAAPLILVIDHDEGAQAQLLKMLQASGYRVVSASNGRGGVTSAERYLPNAIMLSTTLPDMDGCAACKQLKSRLATADIPVIFLADGRPEDDLIFRCYDAGGHDLIEKPYNQVHLLARLRVTLREHSLREAYRNLATSDPHTGLNNRRQFFQLIQDAIASSKREHTDCYLLLFDVENLSSINERYGHEFGDEVILTLARLLKRFSSTDCGIGRISGGTLALIMKCGSIELVRDVCERTSQTFSAIAFDADTSAKHFRISIGAAACTGEDADYDHDSFMIDANVALCEAKRTSHKRICFYWDIPEDSELRISPEKRIARQKCRERTSHAYIGVDETDPNNTPSE